MVGEGGRRGLTGALRGLAWPRPRTVGGAACRVAFIVKAERHMTLGVQHEGHGNDCWHKCNLYWEPSA